INGGERLIGPTRYQGTHHNSQARLSVTWLEASHQGSSCQSSQKRSSSVHPRSLLGKLLQIESQFEVLVAGEEIFPSHYMPAARGHTSHDGRTRRFHPGLDLVVKLARDD